jgi:hypothetical protein
MTSEPLPVPGERERLANKLTYAASMLRAFKDQLASRGVSWVGDFTMDDATRIAADLDVFAALHREPVPLDRWVLGKQGDTGMFYYVMCGDVIESIHHSLSVARRALAGAAAPREEQHG